MKRLGKEEPGFSCSSVQQRRSKTFSLPFNELIYYTMFLHFAFFLESVAISNKAGKHLSAEFE